MKYIGILGHRGSGRQTLAWLIAKTIAFRKSLKMREEYDAEFYRWTQQVISDKSIIGSTNFTTIDSFGGYILDTLRVMHADLRSIDLTDEDELSKYYVRMSDLWVCTDPGDFEQVHSLDEYEHMDKKSAYLDMVYLHLADFIIYWADNVMKTAFGDDVWINLLQAEAREIASDEWRKDKLTIYYDVKTDNEFYFIRNQGGILINLQTPDRRKSGGYRKFLHDHTMDMTIKLHKDFKGDAEQVWQLTDNIIKQLNLC